MSNSETDSSLGDLTSFTRWLMTQFSHADTSALTLTPKFHPKRKGSQLFCHDAKLWRQMSNCVTGNQFQFKSLRQGNGWSSKLDLVAIMWSSPFSLWLENWWCIEEMSESIDCFTLHNHHSHSSRSCINHSLRQELTWWEKSTPFLFQNTVRSSTDVVDWLR